MSSLIDKMNDFCIKRLNKAPNVSNLKGMSISIESPTCCPNYAEYNIDRKVPVRQYFGEENINTKTKTISRKCYAVGTGVSTVGGDIKTTATSPLTPIMKQFISMLNGMSLCHGKYCSKNVRFNHVTVLYYMADSLTTPVVSLKKHCDIVVSPANVVSGNNSQKPSTPTVVLTLQTSKNLDLYKRYSDGKCFIKPTTKQCSMQLNHGDIFVLHPRDERCIKRSILCPGSTNGFSKEDLPSQFQHGVSFKVKCPCNADLQHRLFNVSISVCFRQVLTEQDFSDSNFHCTSSYIDTNDINMTVAMVHRSKLIHKKRKGVSEQSVQNRVSKKLKNFYNKVCR